GEWFELRALRLGQRRCEQGEQQDQPHDDNGEALHRAVSSRRRTSQYSALPAVPPADPLVAMSTWACTRSQRAAYATPESRVRVARVPTSAWPSMSCTTRGPLPFGRASPTIAPSSRQACS